jgi:hypothetical protein
MRSKGAVCGSSFVPYRGRHATVRTDAAPWVRALLGVVVLLLLLIF